jgi:hypothetical protein
LKHQIAQEAKAKEAANIEERSESLLELTHGDPHLILPSGMWDVSESIADLM